MRPYELYKSSPVPLQELMLSAYGLHLRWLRYGARQRRALEELRRTEWLPAEQIRELQLSRLSALLNTAATTVPYYRDLGMRASAEDAAMRLQGWPLLSKAVVRAEHNALMSDRYSLKRLASINTSGTTGTPVTIRCLRTALQQNYAFFERSKRWAGINQGARIATMAGRAIVPPDSGPPYWRRNYAANTMLLSSYHISRESAASYLAALTSFRPALIDAYPSSIDSLARFVLETGTSAPRPSAIITSSETLTDESRQRIELAFGCPVYDQYGAAEMAAFISQCEKGSYHAHAEFGWLELLDEQANEVGEGERGQIVATGFLNDAMPLVRLATGDYAIKGPSGLCECGRALQRIGSIEGRMDDVVITPEGNRVGRLDPVFKSVAGVWESRIVQDGMSHVRVELVSPDGIREEHVTELRKQLELRLGSSMNIDIVMVDSIPRTARGKMRAVVNEFYG